MIQYIFGFSNLLAETDLPRPCRNKANPLRAVSSRGKNFYQSQTIANHPETWQILSLDSCLFHSFSNSTIHANPSKTIDISVEKSYAVPS